jgi:hypothetical protein
MKQRILSGWNFRRMLYLLVGSAIIVQSAIMHEWIGILMGGYFASMGLFPLGCAAGNCFTENDNSETKPVSEQIESIEFEEIK